MGKKGHKLKYIQAIWLLVLLQLGQSCQYERVDPLLADFTVEGTATRALLPIKFKDASIGASKWFWDFGNGQVSEIQNPLPQLYTKEGTYFVTLTVENDSRASDVKKIELVISSPPNVVAQFSIPSHAKVKDTIQFINNSLFGQEFEWTFGQGGQKSTEKNPYIVFDSVGPRKITLIAINSKGRDSTEQLLEVCDLPVPAISTPGGESTFGANVDIGFSCENAILNASDSLTNFFWDFGDGLSSNEKNPTHMYSQTGNFQVRLWINNPCGGAWSSIKQISIMGPEACFTTSVNHCYAPCSVSFSNCSANATSYYWDFGDGTFSEELTPVYNFINPGNYSVHLRAINGDLIDSFSTQLVVDGCGAKLSSGEWRVFMCHNLGVKNSKANPFDPTWEINGAYWQWGFWNTAAPPPTSTNPNSGIVVNWNNLTISDSIWNDNFKSTSDPCPTGFKIPSKSEWEEVAASNAITYLGAWNISATNYDAGVKYGDDLLLPAAGYRRNDNGSLSLRGYVGVYWSSTEIDNNSAWRLYFFNSSINVINYSKASGYSVRCISE